VCRSGIEEEYTENEQLLQEIEDLQREYKSSRKNNNSSLQKLGTQARDTALKNVYTSEATSELEVQELTSPIFSYPNVSPMFSPLSILSPTPVSLQQDSISSAYSTDTVVRNPSPVPSPQQCFLPGLGSVPLLRPSSTLSSTIPLSPSQVGPIRNKVRGGLKNSTLQFLEEKRNKEIELEKQKLQLEQEKLKFEKEKFEVEKKEREIRLELEAEESRHSLTAVDQQRQLMEILLHLVDKPKI